MRVAIDATPLTVPTGGVARYTAEIARTLASCFGDDEFWLLSDQPFELPARLENLRHGKGPLSFVERKWWLWGVQGEMTRLHIDLFHGTDFSVPYMPLRPSVMTLHDLSPWKDPLWQPAADRIRRRTPILLRLGLATIIVTHTEAVRKEAIERFHLEPDRIKAVPLAASSLFHPCAAAPDRPYFLFVGTLEPRKNISCIVEAWRAVRRRHGVDLVLAGRRREDFPALAPEPGLRLLDAVGEEVLPTLYSGAIACLYPSLYEGFGLPVLEAMQCGAMVIASRDPAITEVAAGAALQFDSADSPAWAEAMEAALERPEMTRDWQAKALRRAAEFSWQRTAVTTREIYDEARRRFGR